MGVMSKNLLGFTLLELSVSVLIVGVLIAGIIIGSEMVENAKINTFISELNSYKTAYTLFKEKYGQPPGDFNRAYQIWGTKCSTAEYLGNAALCNGGGDGYIYYLYTGLSGTFYPTSDENRFAWKHLELAGLVDKSFQVFSSDTAFSAFVPGVDSPESAAFPEVGFNFDGYRDYCASHSATKWATPFYPVLGNTINFGKTDNSTICYVVNAAFTPAQMLTIDIKIDDGKILTTGAAGASTGKLRTADSMDAVAGSCVSSGTYTITTKTEACIGSFWIND
jgi:hypothetical protein